MPRHQVLIRLARYFNVVWIDPPKAWREYWYPGAKSRRERQAFREIAPGFTVMSPGRMRPLVYRPAWLNRRVTARMLHDAQTYLKSRGANRVVLYLWRPKFAQALQLLKYDASIYHVDDEYSFSDVEQPNDAREVQLLRAADQVIVHSQRLLQKKGGINAHTALIPNGVNYHAFSTLQAEPPDLATISKPRIGYIGVVKKQLDLLLLARLAQARADCSFIFVGPIGNISGKEAALAELRALRNVHFLGCKAVDELASYTQHMDVCLMTYEINDYTNHIYPLKLHEYLAAGRPTIASPIATVLEHRDVVTLADGHQEWLVGIDHALSPAANTPQEIERRRSRARCHDWDTLVHDIAKLFNARLGLAPLGDDVTETK